MSEAIQQLTGGKGGSTILAVKEASFRCIAL